MTKNRLRLLLMAGAGFVLLSVICYFTVFRDTVRDYDQIMADSTLRVVTINDPLGTFAHADTIYGFHYKLIRRFADSHHLHLDLKIVQTSTEMFSGLQKGKYDVAAYSFPRTTDTIPHTSLTEPVQKDRFVLIQRKAEYTDSLNYIHSVLQLAGRKVYVVAGSHAARLRISHLSEEIGDTIYVDEKKNQTGSQLVAAVAHGEMDYLVMEESLARIYAAEESRIDYQLPIGFTQQCCWAVNSRSTALLDSLNQFLRTPATSSH